MPFHRFRENALVKNTNYHTNPFQSQTRLASQHFMNVLVPSPLQHEAILQPVTATARSKPASGFGPWTAACGHDRMVENILLEPGKNGL
jgi:hypothetical protein